MQRFTMRYKLMNQSKLNDRLQHLLTDRAWSRNDQLIRAEDNLPSLEQVAKFEQGDEESLSDEQLLQRWDDFVAAIIESILG